MTTPPAGDNEPTQPLPPQQPAGPPPYGQAPPPGGYPPPPGWYPPPPGWSPQQAAYPYGAYGANPSAPYGYHPVTGVPFSDKSKIVAGLLQVLLPLGIGRMYMGHVGLGVAQLVVALITCGIGALWPFIDGILILVNGGTDEHGRPLRDGA
ncbi:MAG: TM2 domain-containing protein [Actinomycetota bacterium]|nr:TM2 domain-containing protein [Actinomycetota bacterium]